MTGIWGEIQIREQGPDMECAIDTQHGCGFVSLAWCRSVLDETRDWSRGLCRLLRPPGNRMRLLKEDGGRDQPTTCRKECGGEDKSGRLEVCVQQRGHSVWEGASDRKPWTLKRLWECMLQGAMEGPVHP